MPQSAAAMHGLSMTITAYPTDTYSYSWSVRLQHLQTRGLQRGGGYGYSAGTVSEHMGYPWSRVLNFTGLPWGRGTPRSHAAYDSISESTVTGPICAACSLHSSVCTLQCTLRLRHGLIKHALMDQQCSDPLLQTIVSIVHAVH